MNPRTLLWIVLAAALGAAASYFMAGTTIAQAGMTQRPNSPVDYSLPQPGTSSRRPGTTPAQPGRGLPPATTDDAAAPEALSEEAVAELTKPGEHHEHLDRLAGDWDLTIRVWPSPDAEPIESAGTAEARWIFDRRFLWTIYRAELFGRPFEAWSIEGYDNRAKEYVGTWRDSQGTYTLIYRGKCKLPPLEEGETREELVPDGRYREMTTRFTDPLSGEKLDVRTELRIGDDGGFVQQSFIVLSPEESIKNLELVGARRDN